MRKIIAGIAAAALVIATAGCLTRSITANGVTAKETQFLIFSDLGEFTIETNGIVHIGNYVTQADTNGMDRIADIVSAAVAAAVKAGLISGLAMQQSQSAEYSDAPLGRLRVQSINGKSGPYDLQFVPVAREPNEDMK